jgi:hypothetical protein
MGTAVTSRSETPAFAGVTREGKLANGLPP